MKQIETTTITVPLAKIKTGPYQQRETFDAVELRGLAQTIKANGLITPPTVMAVNGHYELITGDRRRRALFALALEESGIALDEAVNAVCGPAVDELSERFEALHRVEVAVLLSRESDPKTLRTLGIIENLQRADLSPVEKAEGFRALLDDGLSAPEVVERIGERWDSIKKYLLLLEMPETVRERFDSKALPLGVVKELSELPAAVQVEVAEKMAGRKTREIEAVIKRVKGRLGDGQGPEAGGPEEEKPKSLREQVATAKELIARLTMQIHLDGKLLRECGEALSECNPESRLALMAKARSQQIERAIKGRGQKPTVEQEQTGLKIERFIEKRVKRQG